MFSIKNNIFSQNLPCSAADINTEPFLAFSSARDPEILLLEVKSGLAISVKNVLCGKTFDCACIILSGLLLHMLCIKSDALCVALLSFSKHGPHLHLSSSVHELFLCIYAVRLGCFNVHLGKPFALSHYIYNIDH